MAKQQWSHQATKNSDALDLESGVFTWKDPRKIAESLKKSAESSHRRKSSPYQSAMSMLNFYINRAGTNISSEQKRILNQAKDELITIFRQNNRPGAAS